VTIPLLDLQPWDYFGPALAKVCVAVGWLERGTPFPTGAADIRVYRRLQELALDPFQLFVAGGSHGCTLCQFEPEKAGGANLFIPGAGFLFVAPELIVHYMNAHAYLPPNAFGQAVLSCPDMRSMEYKRLFLANGGREIMRVMNG